MEKALDNINDTYNIKIDNDESQKLFSCNKNVLNDVEGKLLSQNNFEPTEFCNDNEELKNNCINSDKRRRIFIEIKCDENEKNEGKKNMSSIFDLCNSYNDSKMFFSPSASSPTSTFSFVDEYMQSLNTMDLYIKSDIDTVNINKKCDLFLTPKFASLSLNEPECDRKIKDTSKYPDLLSTSSCSPYSFYYESGKKNSKIKVGAIIDQNDYKNNTLENCTEFTKCKKEDSPDKSKHEKVKYLYNEDDDLLVLCDSNNSETMHQLSFPYENKETCLSKIGLVALDIDLTSLSCYDASFMSVLNNEDGFSEKNENMQNLNRSNCNVNSYSDSNNSNKDIKNINNVTYINGKKKEDLMMKKQKHERKRKKKQIETNKYTVCQPLNEFIKNENYLSDENNESNSIRKKTTKHIKGEKNNEIGKQNEDKISESHINLNAITKHLKKQCKSETKSNSKKKSNDYKENYFPKYKNVNTSLTNVNKTTTRNFSAFAVSNASNTKGCSKKLLSSLNRLPSYVIPSPPPIPPPPSDIPEPPAIPPPPSTNSIKIGKNYDNLSYRVCNNTNREINNSVQVRSNKKNKRNKDKKVESNKLKINKSLQQNFDTNLSKPVALNPFYSCFLENDIFTNHENIVEEIQVSHNNLNKNDFEEIAIKGNEHCKFSVTQELKDGEKQDKNIFDGTSNFIDPKECNSNIIVLHSIFDKNDNLTNKSESNKCLSFFPNNTNNTMHCNYNYAIEKEGKVDNLSSSFSFSDLAKFSCLEKGNAFDANNEKVKFLDIDINKILKKKDGITDSYSSLEDATPVFFSHPQLYSIGLNNVASNSSCFLFSSLESLFSSSSASILSTEIPNLPISSDIAYMNPFCYLAASQGMLKNSFKNVGVNKKNHNCSLSTCFPSNFTSPLLLNNPYIYADVHINNAAPLNSFNDNMFASNNYNYNNSSTIFNTWVDNDNNTKTSSNILHDTCVSPSLLSVQQFEPIIDAYCDGNFTMNDDNKNALLEYTIKGVVTNIFSNDIYNIGNDKIKNTNILIDKNENFCYLTSKTKTNTMEASKNSAENYLKDKARIGNCTNFKSASIQYAQQSVPDYIQDMFNCLSAEQLSLAVQQTVRYED